MEEHHGTREETLTVTAVVRALGLCCIQQTIHTSYHVRDVLGSRSALEADSLETVRVAGQKTEEVWLWAAAVGRAGGAPVADFVG